MDSVPVSQEIPRWRKYYLNNKEKIYQRRRANNEFAEYYAKHKEDEKARSLNYYHKNKEAILEKKRLYYLRRKESINNELPTAPIIEQLQRQPHTEDQNPS